MNKQLVAFHFPTRVVKLFDFHYIRSERINLENLDIGNIW